MLNKVEFFTAVSGSPSVRIRKPDGTTCHIHSSVHPENEDIYFKEITFWGNTIVFAGIGLGYHIQSILQQLPESAVIIIIDYYKELIDKTIKTRFSFLANRILSISADEWLQKKTEIHSKGKDSLPFPVQIIKHPASYYLHKEFYEEITAFIISRPVTTNSFLNLRPLLLYGNFFLQKETLNALSQISGEPPILFCYEHFKHSIEYEHHLQKVLDIHRPDFIISINMKGFDGNGILAHVASSYNIPIIVWFVDDPHPILLQQHQCITSNILAACWEKSFIPYLKECGFGKVIFLPLATDPSLFFKKSDVIPTVNLGFVGSSMGNLFLTSIQNKFLWSNSLIPLVEYISDLLLMNSDLDVLKTIQEASKKMQISLPFSDRRNNTWLYSYIIHTASMKKRKQIITSLQPLGIETFGDPQGWEELIGKNLTTHPDIDYSKNLCDTYRSIAININITSSQMSSAVNQRVFDVPLSGSFILSDYQKDMEEFFLQEKEAQWYKSIDELKDFIAFYSAKPEARGRITCAAQNRIINEHTYVHRMKKIMELIR